ncbi:MAG: hypothetical protein UU16_C0013G0002 [Candidatus Woesebacteria bacterium GW2011_GWA2_40_7]|uniref:Uncharacterized protein n=3 Tax=Candidatus Woeseibacteriota TaxID=1752722 RepID=A0A0G0LLM4_9BACT|nr:MAG: hypothetical protein UT17_C0004G0290 [Candidatus Woesebacteria bacterium GW2011_GWB1_39_10]KKR73788.1 MAG: hypothetical protein UU16_C0013G0002 [Candidatus Woesebacteria bacterium GW2011_GWA2_40_7]KKS90933.1 MAG: hypothetical protein UV66_C0001G0290 [Candidatus Woesebacteria bacterium GW2011_GWA1_43_12]
MNKPLVALLSRLSYGGIINEKITEGSHGFVETLAGVYEKARNALEYRADNLVRRAAIERILKRIVLLNKNPEKITDSLLTELSWAKYVSYEEIKISDKDNLKKVLSKYVGFIGCSVPTEWILKIASAEIEELFNLNTDYKQFTFFAYQAIRQKVTMDLSDLDLLTFFATDKIYAGSDNEQIAYHILGLAGKGVTKDKFEEAWKLFTQAKTHKELPRISKFVRRQMPPLIILRDMYFYQPAGFKKIFGSKEIFDKRAEEVLGTQLDQMSGKIATAGIRSVFYVFLTKMILAFGLEVPFEIFAYGRIGALPLVINLTFPPVLMWLTTMQIKLPSKKEKALLIERAWYILENFDSLKDEKDILKNSERDGDHNFVYYLFSILYALFFFGVFWVIYLALGRIGYTFFSKFIFIFFLTIIAFFAYRIAQIAKVYSWKGTETRGATFIEILSLPILAIGSRLSQGLSKLNFLAFTFDFILEAPFKIILGFLDSWVQFLSAKKEEQIIE